MPQPGSVAGTLQNAVLRGAAESPAGLQSAQCKYPRLDARSWKRTLVIVPAPVLVPQCALLLFRCSQQNRKKCISELAVRAFLSPKGIG